MERDQAAAVRRWKRGLALAERGGAARRRRGSDNQWVPPGPQQRAVDV